MKRKTKELLYVGLACLLALGVFFVYKVKILNKTVKYDVLFFGDSRIVGDFSERKIPSEVEKETGLRVLNGAFGGTALSAPEKYIYGESSTLVSGVYLSKYLKTGDFSSLPQAFDSASDYQKLANHSVKAAGPLAEADFSELKYVILAYGVNDCLAGASVDDKDNLYNEGSFGGALRTAIENIKVAMPDVRIIVVTPAYFYINGAEGDCNEINYGGGYLKEYSDCAVDIANQYGIDVIDGFNDLGIDRSNYTEYLADGLHFNDAGIMKEASAIISVIRRLEDK